MAEAASDTTSTKADGGSTIDKVLSKLDSIHQRMDSIEKSVADGKKKADGDLTLEGGAADPEKPPVEGGEAPPIKMDGKKKKADDAAADADDKKADGDKAKPKAKADWDEDEDKDKKKTTPPRRRRPTQRRSQRKLMAREKTIRRPLSPRIQRRLTPPTFRRLRLALPSSKAATRWPTTMSPNSPTPSYAPMASPRCSARALLAG